MYLLSYCSKLSLSFNNRPFVTAQRNSESNSSSMKSIEVAPTPKKSKVKDKMKKQFKKAKHSLISKKKDDVGEHKQEKPEKEKKAK